MLATEPDERPVAAHLYGHDPETFARAAAMVEEQGGFDLIDINAGCPVPKVVARGAGAGLLKDPRRLFAIIRAVRAVVSLPVTVKTRVGWSERDPNLLDFARGIEDAGASALALHARPTKARHSGEADWEAIAVVKQAVRIPVIGNGGIRDAKTALARRRDSGVDAIMIARGALGNPWIFSAIRAGLEGLPFTPPDLTQRREAALRHLAGLIRLAEQETAWRRRARFDPETAGARRFRGHLCQYFTGMPGVTEMRRRLNDVQSAADIEALIRLIEERAIPTPHTSA